ncbi:MAG TPA: nuclear transport factor 2 family protein [Longimicrobiaceae bacterium]|nr:nuclear transport factor 2 family protein [Longimicrobiaceae bacterium]
MLTTPTTVVHDLFRAIDARQFSRLRELCHPEIVYERPGYEPFEGIDRLLRFYEEERVIASGSHDLTAVVIDASHAACWGRFQGMHRNGSEIDVEFSDTYEIEDGKIRRRKSFFYRPAV